MKLTSILTITAACLVSASWAQTVVVQEPAPVTVHVWENPGGWWSQHWTYTREKVPLFRAHEFTLDLFGSYDNPERGFDEIFNTSIREGEWGGGVGLNYFLTRHLGFGVDANMSANGGQFVDQALGSVIFRFPIEEVRLAPYVFGGGGRGFDPGDEWITDFGAGLEFRFNPTAGIFSDARYLWPDKSNEKLLIRAGLRLAF